jgi:hypothetical protein
MSLNDQTEIELSLSKEAILIALAVLNAFCSKFPGGFCKTFPRLV